MVIYSYSYSLFYFSFFDHLNIDKHRSYRLLVEPFEIVILYCHSSMNN